MQRWTPNRARREATCADGIRPQIPDPHHRIAAALMADGSSRRSRGTIGPMKNLMTGLVAAVIGAVTLAAQSAPPRGVRVEVSFPSSMRSEPVTGRVYVMISRTNEREPRL